MFNFSGGNENYSKKLNEVDIEKITPGSPLWIWLEARMSKVKYGMNIALVLLVCVMMGAPQYFTFLHDVTLIEYTLYAICAVFGLIALRYLLFCGLVLIKHIPETVLEQQIEWQKNGFINKQSRVERYEAVEKRNEFLQLMRAYGDGSQFQTEAEKQKYLDGAKQVYQDALRVLGVVDEDIKNLSAVFLSKSKEMVEYARTDTNIIQVPKELLFFDFLINDFVVAECNPIGGDGGDEEFMVEGVKVPLNNTSPHEEIIIYATYTLLRK